MLTTANQTAKDRVQEMIDRRKEASEALTWVAQNPELTAVQYQLGDHVWLEAMHLKLPSHMSKLNPKRYGPFKIIRIISPIVFQLQLPVTWKVHNVFHASLLSPYHETLAHSINFSRPPPDIVDGEREQEIEHILGYWQYGRRQQLQYLVKWKGFPDSDNEWV